MPPNFQISDIFSPTPRHPPHPQKNSKKQNNPPLDIYQIQILCGIQDLLKLGFLKILIYKVSAVALFFLPNVVFSPFPQ